MIKRTSSIPTGSMFLSHTSKERLKDMHKKEPDPKAANRILAYMKRKDGMSIRAICKDMNKSYSTIRDWLIRATAGGISFRYDEKRTGLPCRLNPEQLNELYDDLVNGPQACGFESGVWTAPMITKYVKKRYGITYSVRGMQHLLHRIGLSCRRPRPRHPKAASESAKKAFKKKARAYVKYYSSLGYTVLTGDECSHILGWNVHNGWYPQNEPITTPVSLSRQRFYSFGVLAEDEFYCRFYDKVDSDSFCDFLKHLHDKFGLVLLFIDNAACHTSAKVQAQLKEFNGDVKLCYFPPYTPELNPTEGQWRIAKKATANRAYKDVKEMKKSIRKMLRSGEIMVAKMSGYLCL